MSYYCKKCNKYWNYPVENCVFCGERTYEVISTKNYVTGYTKVHVPSAGNEKVPYYIYLLEDENGIKSFKKSYEKYETGDEISPIKEINDKVKVGIVGTGLMGSQIAEHLILCRYETILKTREEKNEKMIFSKIEKNISKGLSETEVSQYLRYLSTTTDYSDFSDCDVVIDATTENLEVKREVFKILSNTCRDTTILATNSSSISIDYISIDTPKPENCIGMHFFNPVRKMDLVEIVVGEKTSKRTKDVIIKFAKDLGKIPIMVKSSPGFIVNRLLLPQINEAAKLLEEGVASKEDIDLATKLGLNHPMGPFELADFIGIDICVSILEVLSKELKDVTIKPVDILYEMVNEGKLGYKTKEGFYKY
jgi:3-hydroxybutyryl-CoA dehydrogenase